MNRRNFIKRVSVASLSIPAAISIEPCAPIAIEKVTPIDTRKVFMDLLIQGYAEIPVPTTFLKSFFNPNDKEYVINLDR